MSHYLTEQIHSLGRAKQRRLTSGLLLGRSAVLSSLTDWDTTCCDKAMAAISSSSIALIERGVERGSARRSVLERTYKSWNYFKGTVTTDWEMRGWIAYALFRVHFELNRICHIILTVTCKLDRQRIQWQRHTSRQVIVRYYLILDQWLHGMEEY